jgi:hypothetical protein
MLTPERFGPEKPGPRDLPPDDVASEKLAMDAPSIEHMRPNHDVSETDEYEFVLGTHHVASLSFVVLLLIFLLAWISYLAGTKSAQLFAEPTKRPFTLRLAR